MTSLVVEKPKIRPPGYMARIQAGIRKTVRRSVSKYKSALKRAEPEPMTEEVQGTLLEANAKSQRQGSIEVVHEHGKTHRLSVPRGMMSDIVKPMFEERVIVRAQRKGKILLLESIDILEEEGPS